MTSQGTARGRFGRADHAQPERSVMASLLARHQMSCATYPGRESSFDKATPANG